MIIVISLGSPMKESNMVVTAKRTVVWRLGFGSGYGVSNKGRER